MGGKHAPLRICVTEASLFSPAKTTALCQRHLPPPRAVLCRKSLHILDFSAASPVRGHCTPHTHQKTRISCSVECGQTHVSCPESGKATPTRVTPLSPQIHAAASTAAASSCCALKRFSRASNFGSVVAGAAAALPSLAVSLCKSPNLHQSLFQWTSQRSCPRTVFSKREDTDASS